MTTIRSRNLTGRQTSGRRSEASAPAGTASLRLHIACLIPVLVAAVIFTITKYDHQRHSWWCTGEVILQLSAAIAGTWYFRKRILRFSDSATLMPPLVMVAAFNLLCEPIQRTLFESGHPFEVLIMISQRNLMLGLAACGFLITMQRLAMLIAVFLTIFSCTISDASGLFSLTILFALAALVWLVTSWWETVARRLAETASRRRSVLWIGSVVCLSILLILPSFGFGANRMTRALRGFMPSSGGNGKFDPYSRGGVNDGDALVAGNKNIKSFAPLEDAPFLDSEKPSLYDVMNDQFDEPVRKNKNQQRAIPLSAELLKHIHQQMAEAKAAGREFSLVRSQTAKNNKRIADLDSPAVFYVAGPVPARFRMEVYDLFDGTTWYPKAADPEENLLMESKVHLRKIEDRHWLSIDLAGRAFEMHGGPMTHSLKIANLDGNTIPSPPQLRGVNIEHVDRSSMYSVSPEKIAALRRKSVPSMTPINVVSEYVLRNELLKQTKRVRPSNVTTIANVLPEGQSTQELHKIAQDWINGIPAGWQQIAEIERRLQENYTLDQDARIDVKSTDAVLDFLIQKRRGPQYLFASSAACLLRTLGYPTRLVGGFYAPPENYDPRKQHTAVLPENAHFWCEVNIGMNTWITLEPTPGYRLTEPPPSLFERVQLFFASVLSTVKNNGFTCALGLVLLSIIIFSRRQLTASLLAVRWKLTSRSSGQDRAIQLAQLVERRMQLASLSRKTGTTLRRWSSQPVFHPIHSELLQIVDLADAATYGNRLEKSAEQTDFDRLASSLSYRRLKQLKQQPQSSHAS